jgi:3-isopropylmalate/(R)-2-methylmalate dehydratase small subunit
VVASSFARIFFRNAINTGLPIVEAPDAIGGTDVGDIIEIDADTRQVRNLTKGVTFEAEPLPDFVMDIVRSGGLANWVRERWGVAS